MDTNDLSRILAEMILPEVQNLEMFAEQKEQIEWASAASVVHTEEERSAVIEAANNHVKYTMSLDGNSFQLSRQEQNRPLIMDLIEEGKPTPYTKGPGGEVQELDGSTSPARSRAAGIPLPWYAWDSVPIEEDVSTMLQDLIPGLINDIVYNAQGDFAEKAVKPFIAEQIQKIGGDS